MPWEVPEVRKFGRERLSGGESGRERNCCGCLPFFSIFSRQHSSRGGQLPTEDKEDGVQYPRCGADVAVKIYHAVAQAQPPSASSNLIICPYSIEDILFALLLGTRDPLRRDLLALLCSDGRSVDDISAALSAVASDGAFRQVNAVLYSRRLGLKQSYKDALADQSSVVFLPVDFESPTASQSAYGDFLREHADSSMAEVLPLSDMATLLHNPLSSLIIVSMLTFSAPWELQFEDIYTKPRVFTCLDGSQKSLPFLLSGLTTWTSFNVTKKTVPTDPQIVILEAGQKRFSVMWILPCSGGCDGLRQLEDSLTAETLRAWRKQSVRAVMAFSIPKFRITCRVELQRGMQALGLAELYRTATGFSDMFEECPLQGVTQFRHNVVFEVDELGIRSSVATVFGAEYLCVPIPAFCANRPFLFVIWHNQLEVPLFIGRITDPTLAA